MLNSVASDVGVTGGVFDNVGVGDNVIVGVGEGGSDSVGVGDNVIVGVGEGGSDSVGVGVGVTGAFAHLFVNVPPKPDWQTKGHCSELVDVQLEVAELVISVLIPISPVNVYNAYSTPDILTVNTSVPVRTGWFLT
jgi:hypothetical protein